MYKVLLSLSLAIFLSVSLHAEQATQESVAKLYVATFDRAPDKAGLNYWIDDSGLSLEAIAKSFFDQDETKELYPDGFNNYDFILAIYNNLFKRVPDSAGGDYWQDKLSTGAISKSIFILAIVNGAKGDDATILENKTQVGLKFVENELEDTTLAKDIMKDIGLDKSNIELAYSKMDSKKGKDSEKNPEKPNPSGENIFIDEETSLMWQDDFDAKSITKRWITKDNYATQNYYDTSGDTATTYCNNLSLDEYDDWRIPSRNELLNLYLKKSKLNNIGETDDRGDISYWSSDIPITKIPFIKEKAQSAVSFAEFGVSFGGKDIFWTSKNSDSFIRCVRDKYTSNKDPVKTDLSGKNIFIDEEIPNIPTLISPENNIIIYDNYILLKWKTINNADTYKLSVNNLTDNSYVNGFTKLNSITISDLTIGKKFFVLVKACNSAGCSKDAKLDFTTKKK